MATLFTWLSRRNRVSFLGLLLLAGALNASDEVPENYDQVHALVRNVRTYAPTFSPEAVAHLPENDVVRMEVLRQFEIRQRNRNCNQVVDACIAGSCFGLLVVYVASRLIGSW